MTRSKSDSIRNLSAGVSRRGFLGAAAAGAAAGGFAQDMTVLDVLKNPAIAAEIKKQQKHVILLWLAGGASQLETWDPKPGRPTGGPFMPISTNVPGVEISELLPKMSQRMQDTAIIRSLSTGIGDHGGGAALMETGRRKEQGLQYPDLGAIIARELGRADSQVPDYVSFYTSTEGRRKGTSGFLGARFAPMFLSDSMIPPNIRRLEAVSDIDHKERADLRDLLARRFTQGRQSRNNVLGSHTSAYQRVRGIMASEKLFNIEDEPTPVREKYGPTQFSQQCLVARRLIEAGVPFVKVARAWWDSHGQNFETHQELCADLDHSMSVLLDDLEEVRREFFARDSREGRQVRKKGDLTVDGLPGESLGAANRFWFFRAAGVEPDSKGSGFSNHRRDGDKEGEGSSIAREAGLIGLALLAIEPESGEHLKPGSIRVYAGQEPTVDAGEFLGVDIPQSIHIDRPRERYAGRDFLTFALDDVAGRSRTNRFGFFTRPFFDELGSPPPA